MTVNPASVSKATDPQTGEPLVYHGTDQSFEVFRGNSYFTPNPDDASKYSRINTPGKESTPNVMPVYLSTRKPKIIDTYATRADINDARESGQYDGVIVRRVGGSRLNHFIVFSPEHIKSATGNNGDFDPANPDIRYSQPDQPRNELGQFAPRTVLSEADAKRAVIEFNRGGLRRLRIAATEADLPASAQARIASEGVRGVRGLYDPDTDTVWLVRQNIQDLSEAFEVGMHELFHRGLRKTFGPNVEPLLDAIYAGNAKVREMADRRMAGMRIGRTEATEEALADLSGTGLMGDIKGWDKLVAFLKEALLKLANALGVKIDITDDMIASLVAGARRAGQSDGVHLESDGLPPAQQRVPAAQQAAVRQAQGRVSAFDAADLRDRIMATPEISTAVEFWMTGPRKLVQERAKSLPLARQVTNAETDNSIKIEPSGIDNALQHGRGPEKVAVLPVLDSLLRTAAFVVRDTHNMRKGVAAIETYAARVAVDGKPFVARIVVREVADGRRFYDHELSGLESARPASVSSEGGSRAFGDPQNPRPLASLGKIMLDQALAVKNESGGPMFSRASLGTLTPAQEAALLNVGGFPTERTVGQRMKETGQNLRKSFKQGLFDQFEPLRQLDPMAYMQARMTRGAEATLEATMLYGKPFMEDGVPNVDVGGEGFAKVLAGLKGEHDRWLWWVAAQRADRLKAQGLENLFTEADISALKTLDQGTMEDGSQRRQAYANALLKLNEFNDAVLGIAEASGLIDAQARQLFKDSPYVPFYRVMEGGVAGPTIGSGLVNQ